MKTEVEQKKNEVRDEQEGKTEKLQKKTDNEEVKMWRKGDSNSITIGFPSGEPNKQCMKDYLQMKFFPTSLSDGLVEVIRARKCLEAEPDFTHHCL